MKLFPHRIIVPLLLLLLLPLAAVAKPTPPADLMKVFALFLDGEDLVEENDWAGLDKWVGEVNKQYLALRPAMAKELPAGSLDRFDKALAAMRDGSAAKQHDRSHDLFISLHKSFLTLLDNFDYKAPPLMYLVQNDLNEVNSSLKSGDMDELEDELKEVELFYDQALPALRARGMKNTMIDEFKAQLVRCKGAFAANNRQLLATELTKLQQVLTAQQRFLSGN